MRTVSNVAAAASALLLAILALPVTPALAASTKGTADCEQMTNPVLKISACTRILQSGKPADDAKASAYHHRGVGYLLQQNFDRAIVEFNEALRIDPAYKRSLNSRGNAWKGKGETGLALADYNAALKVDPGFSFLTTAAPASGTAGASGTARSTTTAR
jgi:tetratricopeptide (TPR) repeat protein